MSCTDNYLAEIMSVVLTVMLSWLTPGLNESFYFVGDRETMRREGRTNGVNQYWTKGPPRTKDSTLPRDERQINVLGDSKFRYWVNVECFPLYLMTKDSKTVGFECRLFV